MPNLSKYCKSIGKPWFLAAWSSCYDNKKFSDDINHWTTDAAMAAHARDMYKIASNRNPAKPGPAIAAVGSSFWNLGGGAPRWTTCDIGPGFPQTFKVVQDFAP
jgi:hypothetical protein